MGKKVKNKPQTVEQNEKLVAADEKSANPSCGCCGCGRKEKQ